MDLKTDLTRHRNIRFSSDGGGRPYVHHKPIYRGKPFFAAMPEQDFQEKKERNNLEEPDLN